jgi:hypothetical protein
MLYEVFAAVIITIMDFWVMTPMKQDGVVTQNTTREKHVFEEYPTLLHSCACSNLQVRIQRNDNKQTT